MIPVWGKNPPIPISDESENVVRVSFLKTTLLMEMSSFADSGNSSHRVRSSIVRQVSFTFLLALLPASASIFQRLFMKCCASGMMKQI